MKSGISPTSVVYLAWLPYGIRHFKSFLNSYTSMPAGADHQLVLVLNGAAMVHPEPEQAYLEYASSMGIKIHAVFRFEQGQDLEIYRRVAMELDTLHILFLNTFSRMLAIGWLDKYERAFSAGVGLIGATASCQSYYSSVFQKHPWGFEKGKGVNYHYRKYKLFIKAALYWRWLFQPFPSPHIRTNAFMVNREQFLRLQHPAMNSKFAAYCFESGRNSMTVQIKKMGLEVLLIDRNGKSWNEPAWKDSFTFWRGEQENLLVSDNQTTIYQEATPAQKKEMTRLAWGIE